MTSRALMAGLALGLMTTPTLGQERTPTPMQKFVRAAWTEPYGPEEAAKPPQQRSQYGDWRRFQGATRCEQTPDGKLTCDNGYVGRGR